MYSEVRQLLIHQPNCEPWKQQGSQKLWIPFQPVLFITTRRVCGHYIFLVQCPCTWKPAEVHDLSCRSFTLSGCHFKLCLQNKRHAMLANMHLDAQWSTWSQYNTWPSLVHLVLQKQWRKREHKFWTGKERPHSWLLFMNFLPQTCCHQSSHDDRDVWHPSRLLNTRPRRMPRPSN